MYWSAVADLFACSDGDDKDIFGQASVSQASTFMFALDVAYDSSNSHVAFAGPMLIMDAVVAKK